MAVPCGATVWRSAPWAAFSSVDNHQTCSFMSAVLYAVFHVSHVCADASRSSHLSMVRECAPVFNIAFVAMRSRVASMIRLLPVPRLDFFWAASSAFIYSRIPSLSVWYYCISFLSVRTSIACNPPHMDWRWSRSCLGVT